MKIFVENFNKVVNGFEVRKVVVGDVNTDAEVEASVATVDYLEIPKLHTHQNILCNITINSSMRNELTVYVGLTDFPISTNLVVWFRI